MAIKVTIRRKIQKEKESTVLPLLKELRSRAMMQKGYISGETWRNIDDPTEYLVISTWENYGDWQSWRDSDQRKEIQDKIDKILGEKTKYNAYFYG